MALTKLTTELSNITALDDEPNDVSGLTATQVKVLFDKAGNDIKTYINSTLTAELDVLPAASITVVAIPTLAGTDVQTVLGSVKDRLDDISLTNVNVEVGDTHHALDGRNYVSLSTRLDTTDTTIVDMVHQPALATTNANIGTVANLTTTAKIVVLAINELVSTMYKKTDWTYSNFSWKFANGLILKVGTGTLGAEVVVNSTLSRATAVCNYVVPFPTTVL